MFHLLQGDCHAWKCDAVPIDCANDEIIVKISKQVAGYQAAFGLNFLLTVLTIVSNSKVIK